MTDRVKKGMNLLAYARVSTKKQLDAGTMENQERIINRFIELDSKYEILEWYKDGGVSAFTQRPEYDRMLKDILENDKADGIIISKLDRIGRSVKQLVNLVSLLKDKHKVFVVVTQNIDTSTPEGELFFHLLSAIAQYEATLIKERMAEGRERAMELWKETDGK